MLETTRLVIKKELITLQCRLQNFETACLFEISKFLNIVATCNQERVTPLRQCTALTPLRRRPLP